ncbi:hypothetical protein SLE2022_348470 [Rubroshorea leprosula]
MEANLVAMAKLNWQLFTDKEKLWCKVIASKYGIGSKPGTLPAHGSPILRYIQKGNPFFCLGIKWIPTDGSDICFGSIAWLLTILSPQSSVEPSYRMTQISHLWMPSHKAILILILYLIPWTITHWRPSRLPHFLSLDLEVTLLLGRVHLMVSSLLW